MTKGWAKHKDKGVGKVLSVKKSEHHDSIYVEFLGPKDKAPADLWQFESVAELKKIFGGKLYETQSMKRPHDWQKILSE